MTYYLLTYEHRGLPRAGLLVNQFVYDLVDVTGRREWHSIIDMLNDWAEAQAVIAGLVDTLPGQGIPLDDVKLLAPILYPGAIYCAGANYIDHVAEMQKAQGLPVGPTAKERGDTPWHFLKTSRGSIVGPNTVVAVPVDIQWLDWEIELAAVIGKIARNVSAAEALEYVAGYTIANDLSARDYMKRDKQDPSSPFFFDWIGQKCFDGACPIGPWIVPTRFLPNAHNLSMRLWVGDELMQDSNSSQLIFSVAEQIETLSAHRTLYPGDLILTGTPAGVGMGRRRFLQSGESVRLWIEGIGEFTHQI
ncbi:fumarylacetoacetate hydrolase family protein [Paraburkholderia sp. RP-4-7]|uniref:Fumarylacetoacetate hydrolase family protein n=1 Tax=Paraburkholderia polaris TaxID=2728848 RepID=A0A848IH53_9BURK|nr:fumarylacetoacetate hydrolase family protein [Paraburkholderia polaris]NMM01542.1 fumarylacetoacetate hydrolase family protein [Paraburkholderia polaris]